MAVALFVLAQVSYANSNNRIIYGITLEDVNQLDDIVEAVENHSVPPTIRIVFQLGYDPEYYSQVIHRLSEHAYIMGQIVDSTAFADLDEEQIRNRANAFVTAFRDKVDIWEIGNELNGEWVGEPSEVITKLSIVHDIVENQNHNLVSAITLNYWPSTNCYRYPWENTLSFARSIPPNIRTSTDYLMLSFYETACSPRAYPEADDFIQLFKTLSSIYPNSYLAIGEVGAQGLADGFPFDPSYDEKVRIATKYYGMHNSLRDILGIRFVGGYFWWYYSQDAVPKDSDETLWCILDELFLEMR